MTPAQLSEWVYFMGMNKTRAAASLGVSRQTIYNWLTGHDPIPHAISLACAALAHGLREFKLPDTPPLATAELERVE